MKIYIVKPSGCLKKNLQSNLEPAISQFYLACNIHAHLPISIKTYITVDSCQNMRFF